MTWRRAAQCVTVTSVRAEATVGSCLAGPYLDGTYLDGAYLDGAYLAGVYLAGVCGWGPGAFPRV